jgi:hypothetical protein
MFGIVCNWPKADISMLTDQILAERGGRQCFTFTQLAMAHQLAVALTGPADSQTPRIVAQLTELLPSRIVSDLPPEPPIDWRRLTDSEFHLLDKLLAKLRDEKAPPARRRVRQQRWRILKAICLFVDEAERKNLPLTDLERHELRGMIRDALKPVIPFELLFSELSARPAPIAEPEPIPEPEPEPEELPPPDTHNVVSLRPDPDTAGLKYGAFYAGSDGAGGHFGDNPPGR